MSMSPEELRQAAVKLFGDRGWQSGLAEALGVDVSTVRRWVSNVVPVPGPVEAAVRCFMQAPKKRKPNGVL